MLILSVIIQILILVSIVYFVYKFKSQRDIEVKIVERDTPSIANDVKDGVKEALREYNYEELQIKEMDRKLRNPEGMYDSSTTPEAEIKSKGELIPFGLSDKDKEILRMFYND